MSTTGIADKKTIQVSHGKWESKEKENSVLIGAHPGIDWKVDVRVQGQRDSECARLKFGFVQCIARFNVRVKWGKSCQQNQLPVTPWWDVADGQSSDQFWYRLDYVKSVNACFNLSSGNQEGMVAHVEHQDYPSITKPWLDPSDTKNILTEIVYDATFVTTLVEQSPSKKPNALLHLKWSVDARVVFDQQHRTRFLRNVVDTRPEAVTMGGAPGVALVNKNKGHEKWVPSR